MDQLEGALPLEDMLNAISAQLDRAQAALALKTESTGLTFAVKELALDLRAAVGVQDAAIMVRPAAPGERDVSTLRLSFTTVTRQMLEEHAVEMKAQEPSITDALDDLSDEEVRRLEWIGVRNLNDLTAAENRGGAANIRRLSRLPAVRLKQALEVAGKREVRQVTRSGLDPTGRIKLNVNGRNLTRGGMPPKAMLAGQKAQVLEQSNNSLLVTAPDGVNATALTLEWPDGAREESPISDEEDQT